MNLYLCLKKQLNGFKGTFFIVRFPLKDLGAFDCLHFCCRSLRLHTGQYKYPFNTPLVSEALFYEVQNIINIKKVQYD